MELEAARNELGRLFEASRIAIAAGLPEHRDARLRPPWSGDRFQDARQDHRVTRVFKIPAKFLGARKSTLRAHWRFLVLISHASMSGGRAKLSPHSGSVAVGAARENSPGDPDLRFFLN